MLFKQRILLANCDVTEHRTNSDATQIFRRQLHTGLLCGNGIVINVGAIVDIPGAVDAMASEHEPFMDNCARLLANSTTNDNPLMVVRGLPDEAIRADGRMDLVKYFETRKSGWIISSMGGIKKAELERNKPEHDKFTERLRILSDRLNELGARAEKVSPAAENRLREHVKLTVETLLTQNRSKIVVPFGDSGESLEMTFAEIAEIAAAVPSRSDAYDLIDALANRRVAETTGKKTELHLARRAAQALVEKAKGEFIDPAYKSIFLNPEETLIDGSFDFCDENILKAVGSLRHLHMVKDEFLASLKKSHPRAYAVLEEVPERLKYVRFIALLFQPHLHANLLLESALSKLQAKGTRLLATAAWSSFQFYYRYLAAAQEFNEAWDGHRPKHYHHHRPNASEHEIIDEMFETLDMTGEIREILDASGHILDDPNQPIASYA